MSGEVTRGEEWEALYAQLTSVLAVFGREDPYGDGDFWVVDDDYGSYQQKVCVTRLSFLTRRCAEAVGRILANYTSPWEVLMTLDFKDPSRPPGGEGILITKSAIQEHWDKTRLSRKYGSEFRWDEHDV
jgi:hypothetical protein